MIQQTTLFNAFIGTLPQKEAMMAEHGQEGKGTREKEPQVPGECCFGWRG